MTSHPSRPVRLSLRVRRLLGSASLASLASLALAGCKHDDNTRVAGWALTDPVQRHPILVSQKPSSLVLRVSRGSQGLSPHGRAELLDFVRHYRSIDSGSRLVIEAPSGAANEVAAVSAIEDMRVLLREQGVADTDIAIEAYHDDKDPQPPIRVSYLLYVAQGPECPNWSTNLAREPDNLPMTNLGCSTQRNFAAQIANPADLLGARNEPTARSAERRQAVWQKYVKGEPTGAKKAEEEKISTTTKTN